MNERREFTDAEMVRSPWWDFQGHLLGVVSFTNPTLVRWYDPVRMVTVFEWNPLAGNQRHDGTPSACMADG